MEQLAQWVAIAVSLVLGAVSLLLTRAANKHSAEALALTKDRREVHWEYQSEGGTLRVTSIGADPAFDVELIVDVLSDWEEHRMIVTADRVDPHASLELDVSRVDASARADWDEMIGSGYIGIPSWSAGITVLWKCSSGAPGQQRWDNLSL